MATAPAPAAAADTSDIAGLFPSMESIPAPFRLLEGREYKQYLVDGKVLTWDGPCTDIFSPVCVQTPDGLKRPVVGQVPAMDEAAAIDALNCAVRAWNHGRGLWPTMTVADRIGCMEKFVAQMVTTRDEVVRLLMWEIGKTLPDSQKEFDRTIDYIRQTISALKNMDRASSQFQLDGGVIALVRRAPLGVCLSMGPFNYPLNETFTTLIPALIMGNTILAKPPKFGGLAHQPILRAFADCFPPGVVNVIYGVGATIIGPVIKTGKVDVLAFIGTSRAADTLKLQHPRPHRMRSILGLDAKNPAFVLPDADLDVAVRECVTGALSFNGQRCTAIKLIFVHDSIADEFVKRLAAKVSALKLGMPWEQGSVRRCTSRLRFFLTDQRT
jgi:glyceraldehyde-3-phosphate dehydrogenase (NADP+)